MYPHETLIGHIRRALDERFPRAGPGETRARLANRMARVEAYLNSADFPARDGGGLAALAQSLRKESACAHEAGCLAMRNMFASVASADACSACQHQST